MRKLFVFILALMIMISAFAALTVLHADNAEADYYFDASAIINAVEWKKYGTVTAAENTGEDVARFVPTVNTSNGYGIVVDIPVDSANYMVIRCDTNLYANAFDMVYSMKSNFDYNYQYGRTRNTTAPNKNVIVFNMTPGVKAAKAAGEKSIKFVKFIPWMGQAISPEGSLSDVYFDVYSVAFFEDAAAANAYADELLNKSYIDYDSLPASDALYLTKDLNNAYAWEKYGYRAYIEGAFDNPFKYIPNNKISNGFGFKVDVPASKAKYIVVRYYTNVVEQSFRIAYSHNDKFDYNYQYGIYAVSNKADQRVALFNMTSAANAAVKAGVSSIEYLKFLPWAGGSWTGTTPISANYFNVYSVAFFENESDANEYKAALEAALPPLEFDKLYDNDGAVAMPKLEVDSTELDKMVEAFKEKEKEFASLPDRLIIYPEYPEQIGRDYDYSVKVSQGDKAYSIPVYNELRQGGATRNPYGDYHRRFCEFAFQGDPVRIDITVNMSFSEYTIIPAAKNIPSTVSGNVISVYVTEPMQLILRLGNGLESNNTNLAIFVDPPEENVPDKDDDNVIYIEGWYEEDDKELNIEKDNTTVYIAPGAVCNARILSDKKNNLTITGRGMVRDPYDTRTANVHRYNYNINITGGKNIRVDGIKVVDCRFYHLHIGGSNTVEIYNVKLLSNQISTDGFPISGTNIYLHDSFADVGDDVFTGDGTNKYYEDMLVGSTCGIFSTGGGRSNETYKDIHIFRADEAIFKNFYATGVFLGAEFENIFAVDCPFTPYFIGSRDQGDGLKNFVFKNFSINTPAGVTDKNVPFNSYTGTVINISNGNPFQFDFENMYIDGELITSSSQINRVDYSTSGAVVNVTTNSETQSHIPLTTNTTVLDKPYVAPEKVLKPLRKGENIVPNGDFEDGAVPWVTIDFSTISLVEDSNSGDAAMYIPATDVYGGITVHLTDAVNRGGSGDYLLEFYAKKEAGSQGSVIAAVLGYYYGEITETTAMTNKKPANKFTLTDEWKKYSCVVNVEVDEVNYATLSFTRGSGGSYPPINFYVDDVSVVKLGLEDAEEDVIYGDVNTDGKVDRKDLTRLAQYFARWDVEINTVASDANGDGNIDRKDLSRLAQYFARWDVTLGK